ncbi:MAG: AAC(3)-I family aminoglycoside N-acetyltransferase [Acidobacteriota bacterium]|mgnify:CR=1 FL=1|jgi:aminoglycoside 3-N-acetyltransferase I|nr:MAG: AAC(3)-I family aminoglycoside N-acetyltransferase [Acidobacteriota bacterium]
MSVFTIDRLGVDDVAVMRELLAVFAEVFEDPETYLSRQPSDDYLRRLLADPSFIALVAREGDHVAGGLAAYELRKFEQERSEVYIYDLGVRAAYRRRGIATGLVRDLQGIAAGLGAWVIYVQADPPDAPAVALYESLGVREEVYHYDIPVRPR